MAKRLGGVCYLKIDGKTITVKGDGEAPLSHVKRESLVGTSGVAGFSETPVAPYIKVTAYKDASIVISTLAKGTSMTAQMEFADGSVYVLTDAFLAGDPPAVKDSGEISIELNGLKGVWQ